SLEIERRLDSSRGLANCPIRTGASRQDAETYFLAAIRHYVYAGDTPLHIAAAAHQRRFAESLVARGADVRARNRRGAEPLHYAVQNTGRSDSGSEAAKDEQGRIIVVLLEHGASPTDADRNGKTVAAAASSDWVRELLGNS